MPSTLKNVLLQCKWCVLYWGPFLRGSPVGGSTVVLLTCQLSVCLNLEDNFMVSFPHMCSVSGPFGERDEEQVFIQRVIPETNIIFVRSSSTGNRLVCPRAMYV